MKGLSLKATLLPLLLLVVSVTSVEARWHHLLNGRLVSLVLGRSSIKVIYDLTMEECMRSCKALGPPCKSITYFLRGGCHLFNITKEQVPGDKWRPWRVTPYSVYFEKAPSDVVGAFFHCLL